MRAILFSLVAKGVLLVLTACGGGGGVGGDPSSRPFEVNLTFVPMKGGFVIGNQSDFGDLVSLRIIATNEDGSLEKNVNISAFSDGSYEFTGLSDQSNYTFVLRGAFSDGRQQDVEIIFGQEENREDHENGGIQTGVNTDGDRRADSVDDDDDNDGVEDTAEESGCAQKTDCDNDGLEDTAEPADCIKNPDCDGDGLKDSTEPSGCIKNPDCDGDGLKDSTEPSGCIENPDCDGDGLADGDEPARCIEDTDCDDDGFGDAVEPAGCIEDFDCDNDGLNDGVEPVNCLGKFDCDNDGLKDGAEAVGCIENPDCDGDSVKDGDELSGCIGGPDSDCDGDGVNDGEDVDIDGDGLIEITTAAQLDRVRYQLDGAGRKVSDGGTLNTTGCGDGDKVHTCNGYELVADISLANYSEGANWRPLGNDTDGDANGCQGEPFSGIFEGNNRTISDLSINRSNEDCVGFFGYLAPHSMIRNLILVAEEVIGRSRTAALVGSGAEAQILSSSVELGRVRGKDWVGALVGDGQWARITSSSVLAGSINGDRNYIGGLAGNGRLAQIASSSVMVRDISGRGSTGILVGSGEQVRIVHSSAVAGSVNGGANTGGLVGWGRNSEITSSSVVAGSINGGNNNYVGGLLGVGGLARIVSSSAVVGEVRGNWIVGGLLGGGEAVQVVSSSAVVDEINSNWVSGGLAGEFSSSSSSSSKAAYSYVVLGKNSKSPPNDNLVMLVWNGYSEAINLSSYWDKETSGLGGKLFGNSKTTAELRSPTNYTGIYATWNDGIDVDNRDNDNNITTGIDDITIWCERDLSRSIESAEEVPENRIWDFGESDEYPAIGCLPIPPAQWRSWWSLDSDNNPQLNQTRLDGMLDALPPSN